MITFPRRVPHKQSVPGGDDPDENIALVLFEEGSIATGPEQGYALVAIRGLSPDRNSARKGE